MITIGIDPGLTGAIAGLNAVKEIIFDSPLPSLPVIKDGEKTGRKYFDIRHTYLLLGATISLYPKCRVMIEELVPISKVGQKGGVSRLAAFSMGKASMLLEALLTVYRANYDMVRPGIWKKYFGLLKQDKAASIAKVLELYQDFDFAKYKLAAYRHGVADAILIARWAMENGA